MRMSGKTDNHRTTTQPHYGAEEKEPPPLTRGAPPVIIIESHRSGHITENEMANTEDNSAVPAPTIVYWWVSHRSCPVSGQFVAARDGEHLVCFLAPEDAVAYGGKASDTHLCRAVVAPEDRGEALAPGDMPDDGEIDYDIHDYDGAIGQVGQVGWQCRAITVVELVHVQRYVGWLLVDAEESLRKEVDDLRRHNVSSCWCELMSASLHGVDRLMNNRVGSEDAVREAAAAAASLGKSNDVGRMLLPPLGDPDVVKRAKSAAFAAAQLFEATCDLAQRSGGWLSSGMAAAGIALAADSGNHASERLYSELYAEISGEDAQS